jgi:hypothetical protein
MKRAVFILIAILLSVSAKAQNAIPQANCSQAERELSRGPFQSWQGAYSYFERFRGLCSDGAQGEALDAYKTRLLDRRWSTLSELKRLGTQNPAFLDWVLLGVFYNPEEVEIKGSNTACRLLRRLRTCSPENKPLCERLATRVGPNPEYLQACPSK